MPALIQLDIEGVLKSFGLLDVDWWSLIPQPRTPAPLSVPSCVVVIDPLTSLLQANTSIKYVITSGVSRGSHDDDDDFLRAVATHSSLQFMGYRSIPVFALVQQLS
jgi:hypothetical protein